nr:hypothetical protein [Parachlamydiaceae bacterium]
MAKEDGLRDLRKKFNHYGLKSIDCISTKSRYRLKSTKGADQMSALNDLQKLRAKA